MGYLSWLSYLKPNGDADPDSPQLLKRSSSMSVTSTKAKTVPHVSTTLVSPLPETPEVLDRGVMESPEPKPAATIVVHDDSDTGREATDRLTPLTNAARPAANLDPISDLIIKRVVTDPSQQTDSIDFKASSPAKHRPSVAVSPTDPVRAARSASGHLNVPAPGASLSLSLDPPTQAHRAASVSTSTGNSGFMSLFRSSGRPTHDDEMDREQLLDRRDEGWKADVLGYVPNYPVPPRYIHVRAHRKQKREFNRVFLAQEIRLAPNSTSRRRSSSSSTFSTEAIPPLGLNSSVPLLSDKPKRYGVWCASFSEDGRFFAAAGEDRVVRVWEVISRPEDRQDQPSAFATTGISTPLLDGEDPDSTRSSRNSRKFRAYAPILKPKPLREFYGHTSEVFDISWSKNNFLLSSSMDKTVRLWHADRTHCLGSFQHPDFVSCIQFHPKDDRFFLSGSLDNTVRLWSIPDKEISYSATAPDVITALAFSPDGSTAIAGCFTGQCLMYDTDGLKLQHEMVVRSTRGRNSKGSKITGIKVFQVPNEHRFTRSQPFDTDVKMLISTNDSRLRLYNFHDRSLDIKFKGHENEQSQIHASLSDNFKYIITGSEDDRTYIWKLGPGLFDNKKKECQDYEYFHSHKSMVTVSIFAPSTTRQILAASDDPIYDICDPPPVRLTPRDESAKLEPGAMPPFRPESKNSQHSDGNIIVTADRDGIIKIFRQDCAYAKRKALADLSQSQKKRLSGITLSPVHTRADNMSTHRSSSIRASSTRTASPRTGRSADTDADLRLSPRESMLYSPSSSVEHLPRASSAYLAGLNGPRVRSVSPSPSVTSPLLKLRNNSSASSSRRNDSLMIDDSTRNAPVRSPSLTVTDVDSVQDGSSTSLRCSVCKGTEFNARQVGDGMRLICSTCVTPLGLA